MMDTQEIIDDILEHHGVKGQKWGVRRNRKQKMSTDGVLSDISGKRQQVRDEKWQGKLRAGRTERALRPLGYFTLTSHINRQVGKATEKAMKSDIKALNKKPEYNNRALKKEVKGRMAGKITKKTALGNKYLAEHHAIFDKHVKIQAAKFAQTSPSGKWETKLWTSKAKEFGDHGAWSIDVVQVNKAKHAAIDKPDLSLTFVPVFDTEGLIVDWKFVERDMAQSAIDDILMHHGVKGQKWGVRRKATVGPQEVVISDKRKRLKTSGGGGHPAHPDAVKPRIAGQIAKKSGLKAVSDKDLQAYAKRIQLEQNVKRMQYEDSSLPVKFVKKALRQEGSKAVGEVGSAGATAVKKSLGRKLAIGVFA